MKASDREAIEALEWLRAGAWAGDEEEEEEQDVADEVVDGGADLAWLKGEQEQADEPVIPQTDGAGDEFMRTNKNPRVTLLVISEKKDCTNSRSSNARQGYAKEDHLCT